MAGRRRIVFVADDLGISPGVNEGIAAAARAGLVREASLCVTGGAVEDGVRIARELRIGVGLHLCFTLGRALSGPIRGLTDARGDFFGLARALLACWLGRVDRGGVAREIDAQLARLAELGVAPTHGNGHHHAHCWPVVRDLAMGAFARAGARFTRLPAEGRSWPGRRRPLPSFLRRLAHRTRPRAAAAGLLALPFGGCTLEARVDHAERFRRALAGLPEGDSEVMVHPRVPDAEFARLDRCGTRRDPAARAELATLCSPDTRELLARLGVEPVGYAMLASS